MLSFNDEIINCTKCGRLREYCQSLEGAKGKYAGEKYWAKPVPGLGDVNARLVIIGLAPAAHGANRTGKPFSGDASDFLYQTLARHGYIQSDQLRDVFITNAVKCAPPKNQPQTVEFENCRTYLTSELDALLNKQVILALGEKAFKEVKKYYKSRGCSVSHMNFGHGIEYTFDQMPTVVSSYHTSRYNLDTKRMSIEKINDVFRQIKQYLK